MLEWNKTSELKITESKSVVSYRAEFKGLIYTISECISGGFYTSILGPSGKADFFSDTLEGAKRVAESGLDPDT